MATTEHFYTGNGSQVSYPFTFPYLLNADVKVELDNVLKTENTSGQTNNHYSISNTNIVFNTAPSSGVNVHIYRDTDVDTSKAVYAAGSSIRAGDLNDNQTQLLYSAQEASQVVRTTDIKDGAVNSLKIEDGTIVNADVNASAAIAGTKISPDFGSQNIATTGTVDGRDVSVDGTKLDTIETNAKDDQTASEIKSLYEGNSNTNAYTDAEKTKLTNIETAATADQTAAEIRTLVDNATDSNVFTDADHTKLDGIETAATADQTNAEIRAAIEAASDSNVFTDADHTKLNSVETGATADQTVSEIKSLIAGSPLDASHLAANSVTTSEIADSELTTLAGMQSGTASKLADSTALTADIADLNQIDGLTKQTTISDSDASFPTSGAVVDYVAAQIAPLGGLEVIATEVAFPNTQPASGVVISISDAGGVVFNGSGVSTTGRTVGGTTVTINGAPSSLNSETLVAGVGLMVSSTGSSQTYNYHKILGKEDDIKQLSDDINDFNARYRVGSSNPTSNNDSGDMFFNTSTGKMMVYNGTNSAWEEVQSIGNFYISTFSESFDGSRTAFTVSNAPSNAQQLIISINGVVQKPNAGTGQPSEGFTLSGSTVTFSSAIPSGSDSFVIVLGSTVNIGTPSSNTVTSAILQNGSVTTAKIADDAVTTDKLANSINTEIAANTAKTSNATHTGEVTGGTALTIADNVVDEANLKVSNSPTNGYFLSAQSGNTGGLTWAEVDAGVTSDGQNNTVAGTNAGDSFDGTNAVNNSLFGKDAGTTITTGDSNVAVGLEALKLDTTGSQNVAIGQETLQQNTTASANTGVGHNALKSNTTGANNVAVGAYALDANTTGEDNTAVGLGGLSQLTTGASNVAVGYNAVNALTTSGGCTGVGYQALLSATGENNTGIGKSAGEAITSGTNNTAVGHSAVGSTTTGSNNIGIGYFALNRNTTGSSNVSMGKEALELNTTGTGNTAIGQSAGTSVTTGSYNVFLGYSAGSTQVTTGSNELWIARGNSSPGNDETWIYGNNTGTCHQGDNSQHWGTYSDGRLKKDIVDNNVGLSVINNVKVRNFKYKQYTDGSPVSTDDTVDMSEFPKAEDAKQVLICQGHTETQLGVIAQELELVAPNCVKTSEKGVKTVASDELFWHMLNAIKELSAKVTALEAK